MSRVRFSPSARRDLLDILRYIAADRPDAATRFVRDLKRKCVRLADWPHLGSAADELLPGLRRSTHRDYVILYRPAEDGAIIVRIVHGAKDQRHIAIG